MSQPEAVASAMVQTDAEIIREKHQKTMRAVAKWVSFYRANPHRFVRDYLGVKLYPFQQIIIKEMFEKVNTVLLACRGIGKTFLFGVFCSGYCILYPGTTICIASKTRGQAAEVIDKVQLLMVESPNLRSEIVEIKRNEREASITFRNGSVVKVVTSSDNGRHNRATVLIIDEFRMVDKNTIDTVLKKFLTSSRMPGYLRKPQYADYPRERTKELYGSSCWYESHWSYELVKSYISNMMRGRSYFCCSLPYQLAIKEHILERERIEDDMSESTFNSMTFTMEMESLFWRQGEGGLYNFDDINKTRVLEYAFYPREEVMHVPDKRVHIPPKRPEEIRILSADIALMASTKSKNDATSIFINQMQPLYNGRYSKNIVYATNNEGLRTEVQALVIRRLFDEFDCDYLVIDVKGLGIGVVDALMGDIYDASSGITYTALSCCNDDTIAQRCAIADAPKKIWAVQGSPEFNSQCALALREEFKQGRLHLLDTDIEIENTLRELKGYSSLTPAEQATLQLPYVHTTLLVKELVDLEYETRNNVIRVKEKPGRRKDRYSSLSYNVYVSNAVERSLAQSTRQNISEARIRWRVPQLYKNKGGY